MAKAIHFVVILSSTTTTKVRIAILHIADACIIIIAASESVSPTPHTGLEQTMSSADEDVLDQNE
jgi:hypothetical protein